MNLYEQITLVVFILLGIFLLTRKRTTKFDKEYYEVLNSKKYKVKDQYS
ncbi:MAG: hypothetical protein KJ623_03605 [Nanoarchaeota archaeon]|nr:hypothetical protein [Nanoarchaeota archaeon]MBU0962321.1 hypothetical protein [Nanoarchaeota archaeon]